MAATLALDVSRGGKLVFAADLAGDLPAVLEGSPASTSRRNRELATTSGSTTTTLADQERSGWRPLSGVG